MRVRAGLRRIRLLSDAASHCATGTAHVGNRTDTGNALMFIPLVAALLLTAFT